MILTIPDLQAGVILGVRKSILAKIALFLGSFNILARMLGQNAAVTSYQVSHYFNERVATRKSHVHKAIYMIAKIVQEILKEVEAQEPRFISTLIENNGRYEGIIVHSPCEYEVILYLNQMGVFNFVDDGSIQGCAVLKLSDGRKRSMSLWVEFITASGYLSARK
ncbi:unnamed protein product, partial [Brugia timori]|uniref:Mab-21 domain-containing protein n=1 Tax=Brugia timori TaxID=42155 RepID=A0A0R3Q9Y1_9BILA